MKKIIVAIVVIFFVSQHSNAQYPLYLESGPANEYAVTFYWSSTGVIFFEYRCVDVALYVTDTEETSKTVTFPGSGQYLFEARVYGQNVWEYMIVNIGSDGGDGIDLDSETFEYYP